MERKFPYFPPDSPDAINAISGLHLMWENPTPTQSMSEVTITSESQGATSDFDMRKYNYFYLVVRNTTGSSARFGHLMVKSINWNIAVVSLEVNKWRGVEILSDKVIFHKAERQTSLGASTTDNSVCIPCYLYGIK